MTYFRQMNKQVLLIWIVLLSIAVLCSQGIGLHVHSMDHGQDSHLAFATNIDDLSKATHHHEQFSKPHLSLDSSHIDHHSDISDNIDISPDGLLKNTNNNIFSIDVMAFIFILIMLTPARLVIRRIQESTVKLHNFYVLSPPVRAPPQF